MSDEKDALIRELEDRLHERDLAVAALAQQLADCNPPQDSDAERIPPPSPSEAVESTPVHTNIIGDEVQSACDGGDLVTLDQVRLAVLHMFLFGTGAECGEYEDPITVIQKNVAAFMELLESVREQRDDSSADASDDRPIITWHDAGDEHP